MYIIVNQLLVATSDCLDVTKVCKVTDNEGALAKLAFVLNQGAHHGVQCSNCLVIHTRY